MRTDTPHPFLSVVVTSRNDNHGGSLLRRMQAFVNGFVGQCKRHNLAAELIIVEWNPPADRPPLVEALNWPADLGPCVVRIIRVPHEIHARMRHSAILPLFQMIAKNVGIRRARGEFVLATNIDILFSDELMEFLASGRLEAGRCYRIDRRDVATDVPVDGSVEEQLAFCRNNHLRLNARAGTVRLAPDGRMCPELTDVFDEGEFYLDPTWNPLARLSLGGETSRWLEKETALTLRAPIGPRRPLRLALVSGPAIGFAPFHLEVRDDGGAVVARGRVDNALRQFDVTLPLQPGEIGRFRFCVPVPLVPDPEGRGLERALRLNYCGWAPVGACDAVPQPGALNVAEVATPPAREIAPDGSILLGPGWIPFHTFNGESMHWATREASVVVMPQPGPPRPVRVVLCRGPAVGEECVFEVVDERDEVIASGQVESGKPILLDLPARPNPAQYRFRARGAVAPDGDGLERVFRLCSWGRGGDEFAVTRPGWLRFAVVTEPPVPPAPPAPIWYRAARRLGRLVLATCRGPLRARTAGPVSALSGAPPAAEAPRAAAKPADTPAPAPPAGESSIPVTNVPPADLHINACGDFTLLARSDWFDLRANPEWELFSLHIDSMMCHIACNAGLRETVLPEPMRIYHIEHGVGSGWTPEGESLLLDRMGKLGVPVLTWQQMYRWSADMRELKSPMIFNGPDWGLAREALPETVLCGAARAAA